MSVSPASGAEAPSTQSSYPGEKFGLPRQGSGSVASMGRHLLALVIDWFACMLIAFAGMHPHSVGPVVIGRLQDWTLVVFAAENYLLTALTGLTLGKRLAGIRVARLDGRPIGLGWALVRTVLFLTIIPPLVTDRDLRGLHDRAANTVVVRI